MEKENLSFYINSTDDIFVTSLSNRLKTLDISEHYNINFKYSDFKFQNNSLKKISKTKNEKSLEIFENTLNCDNILYNLNSTNLDLLKIQLNLLKNLKLKKKKKLILISNILTWEKTKLIEKNEDKEENVSIIEDIESKKKKRQILNENNQENFDGNSEEEKEVNSEVDEEEEILLEIEESENEENSENLENGENDQDEVLREFEYFDENDFLNRKADLDFLEFIFLENLALDLNDSVFNLEVKIICPGVMYGGGEKVLDDLFKTSWLQSPDYLFYINSIKNDNFLKFQHLLDDEKMKSLKKKKFDLFNEEKKEENDKDNEMENEREENKKKVVLKKDFKIKGKNQIPMIHYDDFIMIIKFVLLEKIENKYIFATDYNRKRTQIQIIKSISKGINKGITKPTSFSDCPYKKILKRNLIINLNFKYSSIFKKYNKKLNHYKSYLKLKEEKEKEKKEKELENSENSKNDTNSEVPEEDQEPDEFEEFKNVVNFKKFEYNWKMKNGIVKNIIKVRDEYRNLVNLKANKICIIGAPFSGKSWLCEKLAKYFKLKLIRKKDLIKKYCGFENEFGEVLRNFIEEKKNEIIEKNELAIEKAKLQKKIERPGKIDADKLEVELTEELLIKIYQKELSTNICLNRGYVLDGFPYNYKTAFKLFKSKLNSKKKKNQKRR